jgi:serine/threonine protein kinase
MPLHDSFKQKKTTNIVKMSAMPTPEDLNFAMTRVINEKCEPQAFAWSMDNQTRVLYIIRSLDGANWVLRSGEEFDAPVVWRYATTDSQMIYTLIATESQSTPATPAVIPEELRPRENPPEAKATLVGDKDIQSETMTGSLFADRYEIVERVGIGGTGTVYKAKQQFIDRFVALKLLHRNLLQDETSKKRFEHEAKAASALSHPNLIVIYDFGFSMTGRPFIAMEYVEGSSLHDLLANKGPLEPQTFFHIFGQTCQAISHAHSRNVMHRDLKPSNIVLTHTEGGETVKVVDFGMAKMWKLQEQDQGLTQSGQVMGSPYYMSPEQCRGEDLDLRTDVYSLGCVMYEAIAGFVPFSGKDIIQTLYMHVNDMPRRFSQANPKIQIPEELERIVFKALQKDIDRRYQTVDALWSDLERFANRSRHQQSEGVARAVDQIRHVTKMPEHQIGYSASDLLVEAGIISPEDMSSANAIKGQLGGDAAAILVANGMIEHNVFDAANRCKSLIREGHLSSAHATILIKYCQRSKVDFERAVTDLGWNLP